MSDENMSLPGRFAVYGTVAGKPAVVARFEDNDVWLTQKQLADLFNTTKQNINQHTMAIYDSGELDRNRTVKKYLTVQIGGARSRVGGRANVHVGLGGCAGRSVEATAGKPVDREGECFT